jgi:hypothetical protein
MSARHANGNITAAVRAREAIWSDRSADAARGQEQNRVVLAFQGMEQIAHEMVWEITPRFGPRERADVHFFLDFRLKEPYI